MAGDEKGEQTKHLTRSDIQEQLLLEEKENAKADAAHATKSGKRHSSQAYMYTCGGGNVIIIHYLITF